MYSISRTDKAKGGFVSYWAEDNCNCNPLCPVHHFVFNIPSIPRSPKVPLPVRASKCNCLCIFKISSLLLLSHLSQCLPAHHPPIFTDLYKSCSPSLYSFIQPPTTPSVFRPNTFLIPCSNAKFPCLVVGTKTETQTQTLTIQHA